jgi:N-acetylglucosaminyldiphosphoundecaprenol N-acetyl-beta-D-mannosaminyltransferase
MNLKQLVKHQVFNAPLSSIPLDKKCVINTINPHSYCVTKEDAVFKAALLAGDVLLPDGFGIVLATKVLTGKKIDKIAGADIHHYLLEQANKKQQRVFYLGASTATLKLIEARLQKEFPAITVGSYSPPYKPTFTAEDTRAMLVAVSLFKPDFLFVGMTAPKQEKWVYTNKDHIDATVITSIGAVFDFYAGTVKRSSPFWIKIGLEWLPRLVREPKRLWRRNFVSTPTFVFEIINEKFKSRFINN